MKFKAKPNYFLATMKGGISFNDKGEFETKDEQVIKMLIESNIKVIEEKKTIKKKKV